MHRQSRHDLNTSCVRGTWVSEQYLKISTAVATLRIHGCGCLAVDGGAGCGRIQFQNDLRRNNLHATVGSSTGTFAAACGAQLGINLREPDGTETALLRAKWNETNRLICASRTPHGYDKNIN